MELARVRMAVIGLGVLTALSCGGSAAPTPTPTNDAVTVSIVGQLGNTSFNPNPAIAAGRMVVFRNNDSVAHRVRLNDFSVEWGTIQPGGVSAAFRMPAEGTNYHCDLHPTMIGAVAVDAGTPPPTCRGDYC